MNGWIGISRLCRHCPKRKACAMDIARWKNTSTLTVLLDSENKNMSFTLLHTNMFHFPLFLLLTYQLVVQGAEAPSRVDGCSKRILFNIIWGCLSTTIICAWGAIHPNIPPREGPVMRINVLDDRGTRDPSLLGAESTAGSDDCQRRVQRKRCAQTSSNKYVCENKISLRKSERWVAGSFLAMVTERCVLLPLPLTNVHLRQSRLQAKDLEIFDENVFA